MFDIYVHHQIEIMANNKILVPGCEPTSALSSNKLSSWLAQSGCGGALVNLQDVLDAIPGARVKLGCNFARGNTRQKWLVLPPCDQDCPPKPCEDWYAILRGLAGEEVIEEERFDSCDTIGMGFCPSPDFDDGQPKQNRGKYQDSRPPSCNYKEEGEFPAGVGILPPVPPWSANP